MVVVRKELYQFVPVLRWLVEVIQFKRTLLLFYLLVRRRDSKLIQERILGVEVRPTIHSQRSLEFGNEVLKKEYFFVRQDLARLHSIEEHPQVQEAWVLNIQVL